MSDSAKASRRVDGIKHTDFQSSRVPVVSTESMAAMLFVASGSTLRKLPDFHRTTPLITNSSKTLFLQQQPIGDRSVTCCPYSCGKPPMKCRDAPLQYPVDLFHTGFVLE